MQQSLKELVENLDALARISESPGELTRRFLSDAMIAAVREVGCMMQDAGMTVHVDPVGNLIGRRPARAKTKRTLVLGSHLDTVPNGGRFDGALGVLLPIAALMELGRRGVELPFNVEVVGFSEEEGVRYGCGYIGSAGYTGQLTREMLLLCDSVGTSVRDAIRAFSGPRLRLPTPIQDRADVIGYVEVHIEQGPVLENAGLAVGVVEAIAGQSRFALEWHGSAGHAGTTPMALRRDALTAAAEFTLAVEKVARETAGLVATVGALTVRPGATNVVPGEVAHSLDVRHPRDPVRQRAIRQLRHVAVRIGKQRGISLSWRCVREDGAVQCSAALSRALAAAVEGAQGRSIPLVSGAGHDGVVIAKVAPIAMLFVRCRGGLSHHPEEYASPADIGVALKVLIDFLGSAALRRSHS